MNSFQTFEQVLRARLDFTHVLTDDEDRQRWADSMVRLVREMAIRSYRNGLRDARSGGMVRRTYRSTAR